MVSSFENPDSHTSRPLKTHIRSASIDFGNLNESVAATQIEAINGLPLGGLIGMKSPAIGSHGVLVCLVGLDRVRIFLKCLLGLDKGLHVTRVSGFGGLCDEKSDDKTGYQHQVKPNLLPAQRYVVIFTVFMLTRDLRLE